MKGFDALSMLRDNLNYMKSLLLLILFCFCFAWAQNPGQEKLFYNMKDLAVLEKQQAYEEFFTHAKDIKPAHRNEIWQQMVTSMAQGLAQKIKEKKLITEDSFLLIENLYGWPTLKNQEFFTNDRNDIGLAFLKNCFNNNDNKKCFFQVSSFWRASSQGPELGHKLGNLLLGELQKTPFAPSRLSSPIEKIEVLDSGLLEFYAPALEHGLSEFYCQDPQLKSLLSSELTYYADKEGADPKKMAHFIDKLMHPDCWKQLQKGYEEDIMSKNKSQRDLAYHLLRSKKSLSEEKEDLYLFLYLLDVPSPGDIFNLAWARLNQVSANFDRRLRLLRAVKKLDPLPDSLFATFDRKLKKVVSSHIAQHFPEYFDYYAKTCNQYIKGEGSFPRGNPTLNCRSFYQMNKKEGFVSQFLQQEHERAIKI